MKKTVLLTLFFLTLFKSLSFAQEAPTTLPTENQSSPAQTPTPAPATQTKPSVEPQNPYHKHFEIKEEDKHDPFIKEFINMLSTLGLIVAVLLLASWFLKKVMNTRVQQLNTTSLVKVIEHRNLTPKTSIYLLDIKGEGIIIAESANGVTRLGHFDANAASADKSKGSFEDYMNEQKSDV
jgi:flagellar protein FliO/FliZ